MDSNSIAKTITGSVYKDAAMFVGSVMVATKRRAEAYRIKYASARHNNAKTSFYTMSRTSQLP